MRSGLLIFLAALSLAVVACAGGESAPSPTPILEPAAIEPTVAPTPDVAATVAAGIAATKEAEAAVEATITARVEATKAAEPTVTPTPTLTPTPQPTPTPTSTPTRMPTPTPLPTPTEAPIQTDINDIAEPLYDCLRENEEMKRLFLQGAVAGVAAEGVSEESAAELADLILSSREFFILSFEEAVRTDPWVVGSMEYMLELCPTGGETASTRTPSNYSTTDALAGDLYDCIQENEEYKKIFREEMGSGSTEEFTKEESMAWVEIMLASKDSFIITVRVVAETTEDPLFDEYLEFMLDECQNR